MVWMRRNEWSMWSSCRIVAKWLQCRQSILKITSDTNEWLLSKIDHSKKMRHWIEKWNKHNEKSCLEKAIVNKFKRTSNSTHCKYKSRFTSNWKMRQKCVQNILHAIHSTENMTFYGRLLKTERDFIAKCDKIALAIRLTVDTDLNWRHNKKQKQIQQFFIDKCHYLNLGAAHHRCQNWFRFATSNLHHTLLL